MIRYELQADNDGARLVVTDATHAGKRALTCARAEIRLAPEHDPSDLVAWWTLESARALDSTWTDARDVMFHAARAGFLVTDTVSVRALNVAPEDAPLTFEGRDIEGEIHWSGFEVRDAESFALVALPPASRPQEAARRLYRWARKLGTEALAPMSFDGFVRAAESVLNGAESRALAPSRTRRTVRLRVEEIHADRFDPETVPF